MYFYHMHFGGKLEILEKAFMAELKKLLTELGKRYMIILTIQATSSLLEVGLGKI